MSTGVCKTPKEFELMHLFLHTRFIEGWWRAECNCLLEEIYSDQVGELTTVQIKIYNADRCLPGKSRMQLTFTSQPEPVDGRAFGQRSEWIWQRNSHLERQQIQLEVKQLLFRQWMVLDERQIDLNYQRDAYSEVATKVWMKRRCEPRRNKQVKKWSELKLCTKVKLFTRGRARSNWRNVEGERSPVRGSERSQIHGIWMISNLFGVYAQLRQQFLYSIRSA